MIDGRAYVVAVEADRRVLRIRLEQLGPRDGRVAERGRTWDRAEVRIGHAFCQRGAQRELIDGQLVQVRVRKADEGDLRTHVRQLERDVRAELALHGGVPLLDVARSQVAGHGKHALAEARGRRQRYRLNAWAIGKNERRRDVVERPLRNGLEEREHGGRERRRDSGHFDPDKPISRPHHRPVGDLSDNAEARAEIVLVELTRRARISVAAEIVELLGLQIEDGDLVAFFGRGKVQRIANAGIQRDALRHPPIVLNEVLLEVGAVPNLRLLQIDREPLDLTQEKAGQRRACVAGGCRIRRQIGEQVAECELARRRRGLHDVQPLPAQIGSHFERMSSLHPGERIGNLGHAGARSPTPCSCGDPSC